MGERVRVLRHGGRLLAVKEVGPAGADALRAEAAVLERVRTAGVVDLIGLRAGDPPALLTAWVGPRSLADLPVPLDPDRAAGLCLAVAGTLERLHRAGVVHGALDPTHVLLDAHGRPVLCGFGSAGPIGAPVRRPATGRPGLDGAGTAGTTRSPADDVAGLGRLLLHLLGPAAGGSLRPSARRAAARTRALRAVAVAATADEPAGRPSLGRMVRSLRRAAPEATLPPTAGSERAPQGAPGALPPRPSAAARPSRARRGPERRRDRTGGAERRSALGFVSSATAVLLVGATTYLGLSAWWSTDGTGRADAVEAAAAPSSTRLPTTTSSSTTTAPTTTVPATTTTTPSVTTSAPDPGDGEVGPGGASPVDGPVVEHGGRRYAVGSAGDVVVVGPWRCDGTDLVAVLRPAAGTVHVFDGWAAPGDRTTGRLVTTVAGATRLEGVREGPGCASLVVGTPTGPVTTIAAEQLR